MPSYKFMALTQLQIFYRDRLRKEIFVITKLGYPQLQPGKYNSNTLSYIRAQSRDKVSVCWNFLGIIYSPFQRVKTGEALCLQAKIWAKK